MKFTFKKRHNTHKNDCWCDAISLATNQEYNKVYKMFKPMLFEDGVLSGSVIQGYMQVKGFDVWKVDGDLKDELRRHNLKHGVLFGLKNKDEETYHAVYVDEKHIYDNYDEDQLWWYITKFEVEYVAMKLEKFE